METATFVPKLPNKVDRVSGTLRWLSQIVLLGSLVLAPLFVLPTIPGLALFPKVYLVLFGALVSLLFVSLMTLRNGTVTLRFTPVLFTWWFVVVAGVVSALLSPNLESALFGDALEIHTVGFLVVLGLVMSILSRIGDSKKFILYLYGSFVMSAILLALLFIARIFFGASFLSLGVVSAVTDNFLGSFNDLGIFLGSIVMVSLVTLVQLDLPKRGLVFVGILLLLTLGVLASVNFLYVWLFICVFSLLLLMYVLTKDRFGTTNDVSVHQTLSLGSVTMIGLVFLFSALFLIGGTTLGTALSNITGVNYIEVRPSLTATMDILRPVYANKPLTGIGPNHFVEAWNLHKDSSINATLFWNTPFTAGGGYIPTWFVTTGIFGLVAWVLFLGAFTYTGVRTLLISRSNDSFWYFIGTGSFVAGIFIWILAIVYVPGSAILIVGAICTASLLVAQQKLLPNAGRPFNLLSSSKTGFILIATVMVIIITIVSVGYGAIKQATAAYVFTTATNNIDTDNPEAAIIVSERIAQAYALYETDTYARTMARYQLSYINTLLSLTDPTVAEQQQFQNAIASALNASTNAIARKSTDARNWHMLADIYAGLSLLSIEGAKERAFESYREAEVRDPKNPLYVLQKAAMEARNGNPAEARRLALLALQLKPDFTDALYVLSQLDIAAGNIEDAIATTESIISLEASNPGRYYQLGVLYGAIQNTEAAIAAFRSAIALDVNYANARYFLAQQYVIAGNIDNAIIELEIVRSLNPDNEAVAELITQIKSGTVTAATLTALPTISESSSVTTENGVTTTSTVPDSELLTPVNAGSAPETSSTVPGGTQPSRP